MKRFLVTARCYGITMGNPTNNPIRQKVSTWVIDADSEIAASQTVMTREEIGLWPASTVWLTTEVAKDYIIPR